MQRNVSMEEISDGKLYGLNDMVRADCGDCRGCSACCRGMGASIVLDPLDVHRLCMHLHCDFQALLEKNYIELNMVDGLILPNLKMASGETEACAFLNAEGRCSIHAARPGICRLFPLGRLYENGGFQYFLQLHECRNENRGKVKVKKWIDTPDAARYERYICDWHYFLKAVQAQMQAETLSAEQQRTLQLYLLQQFYQKAYKESESEAAADMTNAAGTAVNTAADMAAESAVEKEVQQLQVFYHIFDARLSEVKAQFGL